jgi:excisionase family DNA binding protein
MSKQDKIFTRLKDLDSEPPVVHTTSEPVPILEAAKSLNVSTGTVRNYIKKGRLDKVLMGRRVYISKDSIERLAQSEKKPSFIEKSKQKQPVDETIPLSSGKALIEVLYLEGLLFRLGQMEAEKEYLMACKADQEKGNRELADTKAKIVELRTKESEARSRAVILEKENKYIKAMLWILVGVGLGLVIQTVSFLTK